MFAEVLAAVGFSPHGFIAGESGPEAAALQTLRDCGVRDNLPAMGS